MAIEKSLPSVPVTVLETRLPLTLPGETTVREALKRLADLGESAVLVTSNDRLAGIFTERDFVRRVLGVSGILDQPMSAVMTSDPVHVSRLDSIQTVIARMREGRFRHIPVTTADRRVVGCVRHEDVGQYLVQHYRDRILNLPPDPEQVARTPEGG